MTDFSQLRVSILIILFLISIVTGAVFTYVIRNLARHEGWVPVAASHHTKKDQHIPRIGGVAVYSTLLLFYLFGAMTGLDPAWQRQLPVITTGTIVFAVGLVDDFRCVPARTKLLFQVAAGLLLSLCNINVFRPDAISVTWLPMASKLCISVLATVFWTVLITNAFNLIDGLDGLAAGASTFSLVTLCGLALVEHDVGVVFITLLLCGAVLGFLRYNFNPASIYLGDSGSLFLGFMLAGMSLQLRRGAAPTLVAVAIPLFSFGLPIVETTVSIIRRFLRGKPLFSPDRDHIHHRLLKLGFSQRQAVILLYGVCAACAFLSLFVRNPNRPLVGLVLLILGAMFCIGMQRLGYPEFSEFTRLAKRGLEQRKVIANNVVVRQSSQVLKRCTSWVEVTKGLDLLLCIGEFDGYILETVDGTVISRTLKKGTIIDSREFLECRDGIHKRVGWSVSVDLRTRGRWSIGQLTIGRAFRRRSILLDLNVLLRKLQPALSVACERLQSDAVQQMKLVESSGSLRKVPRPSVLNEKVTSTT